MVAPPPNDWRLAGPLQPMRFEATVEDCVVSAGEVPEGLVGGLYRSGPTWKRPTRQNCNGWWTMDGMVQALTFDGSGRVDFRNRWIRTPKYLLEEQHGRGMFEWSDGFDDWRCYGFGEVTNRDEFNAGVPVGTSWVNAFPFQGDVVVSGEQSSPPIRVDPLTLETKGFVPWSPQLSPGFVKPAGYGDGAFTPHPKWDAETGELFGWTYRDVMPYATLHWVRPDGSVRTRDLHDAPHGTILHDAWLTPTYLVLPFMPLIGDLKRCEQGLSIYDWDTSLPIVLGLVRRDDFDGEIRWIDTGLEPQYIMHTLSANEVDGKIQLDAPIYDRPPLPFEDQVELGAPFLPTESSKLGRWTVDPATGVTTAERIDDRAVEFPKVDERFYGAGYRHGFLLAGDHFLLLDTLVKRDIVTGAEQTFKVKDSEELVAVFEPSFAPRTPDAPEADGYLIVPICRFMENRSGFLIFDTHDISQGPITRIDLPFQMGWTPHGHWMDRR